jgi:hypothetical protein
MKMKKNVLAIRHATLAQILAKTAYLGTFALKKKSALFLPGIIEHFGQ